MPQRVSTSLAPPSREDSQVWDDLLHRRNLVDGDKGSIEKTSDREAAFKGPGKSGAVLDDKSSPERQTRDAIVHKDQSVILLVRAKVEHPFAYEQYASSVNVKTRLQGLAKNVLSLSRCCARQTCPGPKKSWMA